MKSKCNIIENEIREMISELEQQHDVKLSTTQKILLTINGPVTPILDVLYGKIRLFMLEQHFEKADEHIAELVDVNEGDDVLYRSVVVFKRRQPLIYVVSYIPKERCSDDIIGDLLEGKLTTGKIIDKYEHETIRKINKISIEKASSILTELFKTNECMLTREYAMIHDKKIIMWTKEVYPLSYFKV